MAEMITDKTMDEIEILAKLHLTEDEKEKSRQDLQQMLDYVDMLNQLDTSSADRLKLPLLHPSPESGSGHLPDYHSSPSWYMLPLNRLFPHTTLKHRQAFLNFVAIP